MEKSGENLSSVVSKDDVLEIYKLFGYYDAFQKGVEPDGKILKDIEENPLKFFTLPKTITYLKITGENPSFYDSALSAFEKGIKKPDFKKFIEQKGVSITSLVVKSRKDFLQAKEEVEEIEAKIKKEQSKRVRSRR